MRVRPVELFSFLVLPTYLPLLALPLPRKVAGRPLEFQLGRRPDQASSFGQV